jgi:hypothetical protein
LIKLGEDDAKNQLSNQLSYLSIPKDEKACVLFYIIRIAIVATVKITKSIKSGWRIEMNPDTEVQGHAQKIDGKNMMHCMRS